MSRNRISTSLDASEYEAVQEYCDEHGYTDAEGIRQLVSAGLEGGGIRWPTNWRNCAETGPDIGGGLAGGSAGVSRRKIGVTLGFWIVTLVTSALIGFGLYRAFDAILGG